MEQIPKDKPILFIAEGLLMYFTENEVKSIFQKIGEEFPTSEMIFEAMSPFLVKQSKRHPDLKYYNAPFKWGIKTGKNLEKCGMGIQFIDEWYYFDRHKDKQTFFYRAMNYIPMFRKMMKIVYIRF